MEPLASLYAASTQLLISSEIESVPDVEGRAHMRVPSPRCASSESSSELKMARTRVKVPSGLNVSR